MTDPGYTKANNSNARSTKTRIETCFMLPFGRLKEIRMQDPLKQGLKPACSRPRKLSRQIRMQDPLKQGLKQNCVKL